MAGNGVAAAPPYLLDALLVLPRVVLVRADGIQEDAEARLERLRREGRQGRGLALGACDRLDSCSFGLDIAMAWRCNPGTVRSFL